jgi:hypothetical protein
LTVVVLRGNYKTMVKSIEQIIFNDRLYEQIPYNYPFSRTSHSITLIDNTIAADTQKKLFFMITPKRFLYAGEGMEG